MVESTAEKTGLARRSRETLRWHECESVRAAVRPDVDINVRIKLISAVNATKAENVVGVRAGMGLRVLI